MTLLYKKHYFGRLLFILEVDNKLIMCYLSSGLSGTGHKDQILPFMFINDPQSPQSIRDTPGYIYKEMWYDNKFRRHNKNITWFKNLEENMQYIRDYLSLNSYDTLPPTQDYNDDIFQYVYPYMHIVSTELHYICKGREFFDLQNLISESDNATH